MLLTSEKAENIKQACHGLLRASWITIWDVAQVIGLLVAAFPAVPHGQLYYRQLELDKSQALAVNSGDFDRPMHLSPCSISDLHWWIDNIKNAKNPIRRGNPDIVIESGASTLGWGAVLPGQGKSAEGESTTQEALLHINRLELKAAFFALKSFSSETKNTHVRLQVDNVSCVAYVREMGGSHSQPCNQIARQFGSGQCKEMTAFWR